MILQKIFLELIQPLSRGQWYIHTWRGSRGCFSWITTLKGWRETLRWGVNMKLNEILRGLKQVHLDTGLLLLWNSETQRIVQNALSIGVCCYVNLFASFFFPVRLKHQTWYLRFRLQQLHDAFVCLFVCLWYDTFIFLANAVTWYFCFLLQTWQLWWRLFWLQYWN